MKQKNKYRKKTPDKNKLFSILQRILGSILGVSLLFAFLLLLSWGLLQGYTWLTNTPYFAVEEIRIQGNKRLQRRQILNKADLSRGGNSLKISIGDIEKNLLDMAWIKEVEVRRKLPDQVSIRIQEKEAVFFLSRKKKIYYTRANGEIISALEANNSVSLPFLYYKKRNAELVEDLLYLQKELSAKNLPFSMAKISWIDFVGEQVVEMFLRDFQILIRMGREKLKSNSRFLGKIWRDLLKRGELGSVKTIRVYANKGWVGFNRQVVAD